MLNKKKLKSSLKPVILISLAPNDGSLYVAAGFPAQATGLVGTVSTPNVNQVDGGIVEYALKGG